MVLKNNIIYILKTVSYSLSILLIMGILLFYFGNFEPIFLSWLMLIFLVLDFPAWLLFLTYFFRNFRQSIVISDEEISIRKRGGAMVKKCKLCELNSVTICRPKSDIVRHPSMNYFYIKVGFKDSDGENDAIYITCLMMRKVEVVVDKLNKLGLEEYRYSLPFLR